MVNDYQTVFSYQAFIAKYLHVTDLILHGLLIIQKQPLQVLCKVVVLNPTMPGKVGVGEGGEVGGQIDPPCAFSKNVFSKERVKPCFFVTFKIISKHIFPENFIEFPQVV